MKKEQRQNKKFVEIDLGKQGVILRDFISKEVKRKEHCGLTRVVYLVLPEFGTGNIIEYHFEGVIVSINDFVFKDNFIFYNELEIDALYFSFLVKGEIILQFKNVIKEVPYEESEAFMSYIKKFTGTIKVYNKKPFKEIKIIVSNAFLSKYRIDEGTEYKKVTDKNLILPITHKMFSVLEALELQHGEGLVQRIYLEAKVLEIIALQIENYKNFRIDNGNLINQKPLKKLFVLKQFLKENLDKNHSVCELATEVGLSEHILKSEFKRVFNCSVNQYYINQKMQKAKQFLQNTELPIYQIAENVGYKNATHFTAAFKRKFYITPKQFRQQF